MPEHEKKEAVQGQMGALREATMREDRQTGATRQSPRS